MYFIVYILQTKEHHVVPYKWTRGINYESTMNDGLNRNLKFRTFWTRERSAFDANGVPRINYTPEPNAPQFPDEGKQFPDEGWYQCKAVKFKGKCRKELIAINCV